jgi:hypothetical protein
MPKVVITWDLMGAAPNLYLKLKEAAQVNGPNASWIFPRSSAIGDGKATDLLSSASAVLSVLKEEETTHPNTVTVVHVTIYPSDPPN